MSSFTRALLDLLRLYWLYSGLTTIQQVVSGFTQALLALLRLYYALPLGALGENEGIAWQLAQSLQGPQRP